MRAFQLFLRVLAGHVLTARLQNGARVLDASDAKYWLLELADRMDKMNSMLEFLDWIEGRKVQ